MIKCDCCSQPATVKHYRGDNKFFVCDKHFIMDNRNFYKALKRERNKK